jgi:hypothetical protein
MRLQKKTNSKKKKLHNMTLSNCKLSWWLQPGVYTGDCKHSSNVVATADVYQLQNMTVAKNQNVGYCLRPHGSVIATLQQ